MDAENRSNKVDDIIDFTHSFVTGFSSLGKAALWLLKAVAVLIAIAYIFGD